MTKVRVKIIITLVLLSFPIIWDWIDAFREKTAIDLTWRNGIGIVFFLVLWFLAFQNPKKAVLATGIFLIAGTLSLLGLFRAPMYFNFNSWTPNIQIAELFFLLLYIPINFSTLRSLYREYKERKKEKATFSV